VYSFRAAEERERCDCDSVAECCGGDALAGLVVVLFEIWREQMGAIFRRLRSVGRRLAGRRRMSMFSGLLCASY